MQIRAVGIPWYHEQDYPTLLKLFEDGHLLHDTYHEWLEAADGAFERFKSSGAIVEKVYITPEDFPAWCAARRLHINADARGKFASEFVARKYPNQS